MAPQRLIIWGASGHAAVVAEAARAAGGFTIAGYLDDDPARTGAAYFGGTILGTGADLPRFAAEGCRVIFGFGHCAARQRLAAAITAAGIEPATVVHPRAWVSPTAVLGPGVFVGAGAMIQARARVAAHTIVNTGAIVEHDCEIAEAVHLAPGVKLAGGVRVGAGAWIGLGACVLENRGIGPAAVIGAGAVVVQDVPERALARGVPARVARILATNE